MQRDRERNSVQLCYGIWQGTQQPVPREAPQECGESTPRQMEPMMESLVKIKSIFSNVKNV